MRVFAHEFVRRRARRWKAATRRSNLYLLRRNILPCLGGMPLAAITCADVRRWFDSLSGTQGAANRALPVLSVMMTTVELWDVRPQGSNPCRNMRRYRTPPRERFLSPDELKRLGFVLDHAEDRQAATVVQLLLLTGARSSEIAGLRWDWIRGAARCCPTRRPAPRQSSFPPRRVRLPEPEGRRADDRPRPALARAS